MFRTRTVNLLSLFNAGEKKDQGAPEHAWMVKAPPETAQRVSGAAPDAAAGSPPVEPIRAGLNRILPGSSASSSSASSSFSSSSSSLLSSAYFLTSRGFFRSIIFSVDFRFVFLLLISAIDWHFFDVQSLSSNHDDLDFFYIGCPEKKYSIRVKKKMHKK